MNCSNSSCVGLSLVFDGADLFVTPAQMSKPCIGLVKVWFFERIAQTRDEPDVPPMI
jgi:hypothetical protein